MATIRISPSQVEIAQWALRALKDRTPDEDMPQLAGCAILLSRRPDVNEQFAECVAGEMWMPFQATEICADQTREAIARRSDAESLLKMIRQAIEEERARP